MRIRVGLCLPVAVSLDGRTEISAPKGEKRGEAEHLANACISARNAEYKAEVTRVPISTSIRTRSRSTDFMRHMGFLCWTSF